MLTVCSRRVLQSLGLASIALSLAACGNSSLQRSLTICGVQVTTDARASVAVVAETTEEPVRAIAYAMLGETGGSQTVGGKGAGRVQLRFAIDAEIWVTDAAGTTRMVESPFRGLSGANVDRSTIELRGGKATASLPASAGDTVAVTFDGSLHVVHSK